MDLKSQQISGVDDKRPESKNDTIGVFEAIQSKLYQMFYKPICRQYSKHILKDRPADALYTFLFRLKFWKDYRYWPHLKNPRSFSEKVCRRMLFDRDPFWTMVSDKLRVREYVANKIGSEYLVPLLWKGDIPEEIPFDELPLKFIIKATHGCKYNIIVKDKTVLNQKIAIQQMKKWLAENFCQNRFLGTEWAYKNIKPGIIVEAFLDNNGKEPEDYKFFCYSGRAEYLQMNFDRFGDSAENFYDRDFNKLDIWNGAKSYQGKVVRCENYEKMVQVAEDLARGIDFIRVDLYNVGSQIYFGELTCYPGGGMIPFVPEEYDFIFGKKWVMK